MRLHSILSSALLVSTASANLTEVVDLTYSKYQGVALSNGVTQWLGMRYAAPPIGSLRFMPPQDPLHIPEIQLADTVSEDQTQAKNGFISRHGGKNTSLHVR